MFKQLIVGDIIAYNSTNPDEFYPLACDTSGNEMSDVFPKTINVNNETLLFVMDIYDDCIVASDFGGWYYKLTNKELDDFDIVICTHYDGDKYLAHAEFAHAMHEIDRR